MNIQSVTFHNQEIQVLNHDGKPYVAMRSVVENIGLDWASQYRRIRNNEVLYKGIVMMTTPSKGGLQEILCLPLGYLNGWLFGIEINRCKPEIRDILRLYQLECFDVLYKHFMPIHEMNHPVVTEEVKKLTSKDRRWFVEVRVTDNLFKGSVEFLGVAHDTNAVVTCIAQNFGFQIHSMSKVGDALEKIS